MHISSIILCNPWNQSVAIVSQHARAIMVHLHAILQNGLALRDYGLVDLSSPTRVVARHILMQQLDGELVRAYSFDGPDLSTHCYAYAWLYGCHLLGLQRSTGD